MSLFDREEEVAKLQDAFVQCFLLSSSPQPQDLEDDNDDDDEEVKLELEDDASDFVQRQQKQTKNSNGKKKKKRMQKWVQQQAKEAQQQAGKAGRGRHGASATTNAYTSFDTAASASTPPRYVVILVSPAGTGKTTLVHSALQPLVEETNGISYPPL
jgi:flagellar biosynthesis GTPase FlhF